MVLDVVLGIVLLLQQSIYDTQQGDERGNFKVFENPVYSTFNFTYDQELGSDESAVLWTNGFPDSRPWNPEQESFDNLSNLMEYNVLNNAKVVRDEISQGKNFEKINRKCVP